MSTEGLPYVSQEAFELAQSFEKRLQEIPPEAGILFVGVSAAPVPGGDSKSFSIILGISRKFEESTGEALVRNAFAKEIGDAQIALTIRIYRGSTGAANHRPVQGPHQVSA